MLKRRCFQRPSPVVAGNLLLLLPFSESIAEQITVQRVAVTLVVHTKCTVTFTQLFESHKHI